MIDAAPVVLNKELSVLFARIPKYHKALLEAEAIRKGVHVSKVLSEIIEYFMSRNMQFVLLDEDNEDKGGTFHCQGCGKVTKNKNKYKIQVLHSLIAVGECCFINDHYKDLIRALL